MSTKTAVTADQSAGRKDSSKPTMRENVQYIRVSAHGVESPDFTKDQTERSHEIAEDPDAMKAFSTSEEKSQPSDVQNMCSRSAVRRKQFSMRTGSTLRDIRTGRIRNSSSHNNQPGPRRKRRGLSSL
jgi:hypothetical protein